MGRRRHRLKKGKSKRLFRKTAKPHGKNNLTRPMRGGIRL